jgi:hypothetical protein
MEHSMKGDKDDSSDSDELDKQDGALDIGQNQKGKERKRATWQQRLVLENLFQTNQYPDFQLRAELAKQLKMSPRKVQVWFQNRRTKAKNKQIRTTQDLIEGAEQGGQINIQNDLGTQSVYYQNSMK